LTGDTFENEEKQTDLRSGADKQRKIERESCENQEREGGGEGEREFLKVRRYGEPRELS